MAAIKDRREGGREAMQTSADSAEERRREARGRRRRIIMNNDGEDHPSPPVTPESFLARRTNEPIHCIVFNSLRLI